ncbi:complement factor H-related protein 1-like [Brachyistius frenatus]|uniref:complement factor H-related protein 1-like n=1 Tax=Brachyistius frenatus TaxID=100188 RepID=UPI0037E72E35
MCVSYLGFVFLIWFPGVLHAQSAAEPCPAPVLNGGYLVPKQDTYPDKTAVTYACDNGLKPAVEGWWATSTCQNGRWSHEPQCIDENYCLPPTITNGKYTENRNVQGQTIDITCNEGYEVKDRLITATCINQTWSSLPVCERSNNACVEPPQIPHAVILERYQEVFAANSRVRYGCKTGYTPNGRNTEIVTCSSGQWNGVPTCRK